MHGHRIALSKMVDSFELKSLDNMFLGVTLGTFSFTTTLNYSYQLQLIE